MTEAGGFELEIIKSLEIYRDSRSIRYPLTLSRMEWHLIAAEDGGHFGPHRGDTVKATEHRLSISLYDDFDRGEGSP
jgi:hypothetical protein